MRGAAWLGVVLLAGLLTGVAGGPAQAQKSADTLRVTWRDAIPDLDYYRNALRTGLVLSHHVWDTLVYRDPETFQLKPLLATSWRYVNDTTLEFDLRPGVLFHDGTGFTADDVVATVESLASSRDLATPSNYAWMDGAEKVDELKVRIRLKRVFPAALEYIAMAMPIYPEEYKDRAGQPFSQKPVGTGPYKVVRVDGTSSIELVRNDEYFEGPKGKPAIRNIVITEVADATAELAAILGGQADWIWNFGPDQIEPLGRVPGLQVQRNESMRVGFLNLDAAARTGESPLTSPRVRQAIMHSIDRPAMVRQFMQGARMLDAPCYPTQFGCDVAVAAKYEYDPAKARALLAEAGFPNGFEIEMVGYLLPQWQGAIQTYLAAVGIKTRLVQLRADAVVQRSMDGKNPMELGSWGSYSINDVSAFMPYFFGGGARDYARDPEVERLVTEGGQAADPDRRRAAYSAAIRRITEQAYFLPLFTYVTTYASSRSLALKTFRDELPRFYLAAWR